MGKSSILFCDPERDTLELELELFWKLSLETWAYLAAILMGEDLDNNKGDHSEFMFLSFWDITLKTKLSVYLDLSGLFTEVADN